jgi:hypothetical protein
VHPPPTACWPSSLARAALQLTEVCRVSVVGSQRPGLAAVAIREARAGALMAGGGGTARASFAGRRGCWVPLRGAAWDA